VKPSPQHSNGKASVEEIKRNDRTLLELEDESESTVLVVDDDLASLLMVEQALSEAGFNVIAAENGEQAVQMSEQHSPDLIIMDVVMPVMNGFDACVAIRAQEWGLHIPILMVTGLEDIESINQAYEVGATDFLTKPINFFVLPHRVRYMLRSKHTADELRASQWRLDQAQRIAQLGHWQWDRDTRTMQWSNACVHILPVVDKSNADDMVSLVSKIHDDDQKKVIEHFVLSVKEGREFNTEFKITTGDDASKMIRVQGEPQCDESNRVVSMLGTIQDVTERYNAQQQIHNLAYYDHITGLPNRAMLYDRLTETLSRASRDNSNFAILFLDLDRFKQVNDTLGHDAGDDLLKQVSIRLREILRQSDITSRLTVEANPRDMATIARLGGDEFVVLLSRIEEVEDAALVARRVAARIAETYEIKESVVNISTTIGISIFPHDGNDAEALLKNADIAMYHAKKRGRNGFQFYSEEIHRNAQTRFEMEQDLRRAIEEQQFRLVFQPKVCCRTGVVTGVESLIRWDHPRLGEILPTDFITLAEDTELIIPLGEWILETACRQMKKWHKQGYEQLHVAVNCSSIQLMRADISSLIRKVLEKTELDPKFLEIELTESLLLDDAERGIEILSDLRSIGIMTSIDDFGTGFSSMSYLRRLPVSKLKIDRSFVGELGRENSDSAIVCAILTLAKHLNLEVVAEGVETYDQQTILIENGCDELQGFCISKPLDEHNFLAWVDDWHQQQFLRSA